MPAVLRALLAASVVVLTAATSLVSSTGTALADSPAKPTQSAHPFSDPTWFPLRTPATIGCAKSGCGTSSDHGFDAIDLLGDRGDPVYAAGAGVAHIGGNSGGCSGSDAVEAGRWVWIDHGGGVTSRYRHLDSIAIRDGQLVTPATRIGAMGHSGDVPPCSTNYLHFEVRHGGLDGDRVDFGPLRGCQAGRTLVLPEALGFTSWNDPGLHPKKRLTSPALDSSCVTADWATTAPRPAPAVSRAPGSVTVALAAPARATSWMVDLQIWRPTLKGWRTLTTATVPAGTPEVVLTDGVEDHRRYRVRTAVHQGQGWSAWSGLTEVTAPPGRPGLRYLQWKRTSSSSKSYLHYGWSRPDTFGSATTRYSVARRCGSSPDALGRWKTTKLKGSAAYVNLRGLGKAKACEVRIRATNAAGTGPWTTPRLVRR